MAISLEFNARALKPADVAKTFVPPASQFERLVSLDHHILLGPRGSGKTTLLKMLTLPALANWTHPKAEHYRSSIHFNSAFIPTDRAWSAQSESRPTISHLGEMAFSIHTVVSLLVAMQQAVDLGRRSPSGALSRLAVSVCSELEVEIARTIAATLGIEPVVPSLLGVELALRNRLLELRSTLSTDTPTNKFFAKSLPDLIVPIISAFNSLTGDPERRWAFLFDELEIAPTEILNVLINSLRGRDNRIVLKLAMSPFHKDLSYIRNLQNPQLGHDFHVVNLTYARKNDAMTFSADFTRQIFTKFKIGSDTLDSLFERSKLQMARIREKDSYVPDVFFALAEKDPSFRQYAEDKKLFEKSYSGIEDERAADIRKILPIVLMREYSNRDADESLTTARGLRSKRRSRKAPFELYAGMPSMIEITEGNPRTILTLMVPLAQELAVLREQDAEAMIPVPVQSDHLEHVTYILESLVRAIPTPLDGMYARRGLLGFLNMIGEHFESRLLDSEFEPDYQGSFTVDSDASENIVNAVGNALNAGALIFLPDHEIDTDSLLFGLRGKRFRLSYQLNPRFRLPLILGFSISLGSILKRSDREKFVRSQSSLFDRESRENQ
ncbi:MAG TPA: hypothetical protein VGI20_13055 [Rhizomicrobium sp.]|jgi:hypothetical protein